MPRPTGAGRPLLLASLLAVAALGLIYLPHPFSGDQALFLTGARQLSQGGTLYLDYWDNKQPGLYTFFLLGGRLFGFTEIGIHLLELLTLLLLAGIAVWSLLDWIDTPGLAALIPLATVGAYYCVTDSWFLTQLEILVTLPILLVLLLVARPQASPIRWFYSGLAAVGVLWFKLILAPIPVAIWLVALGFARQRDGVRWRALLRRNILPALAGFTLGLSVIVLQGLVQGNLSAIVWTAIGYPLEALGQAERAFPERLLRSTQWWVHHFWPWIVLSLAAILPLRESLRDRRTVMFLAWIGMALALILVQVYSWWSYHFLLLAVPLGALGVRGLDRLLRAAAGRSRWVQAHPASITCLAAFLVILPGLADWAPKARRLAAAIRSGELARAGAYQRAIGDQYEHLTADAAFLLAPEARPGSIYVIGTPIYLLLTGRRAAIPINGWSWGKLVPSQLERIPAQLARAAPAYVYVARNDEKRLARCCRSIETWLADHYRRLKADGRGTWYESRSGRTSATPLSSSP